MVLLTVLRASHLSRVSSSGVGGLSSAATTDVLSSWSSSSLVATPDEVRPGTLLYTPLLIFGLLYVQVIILTWSLVGTLRALQSF